MKDSADIKKINLNKIRRMLWGSKEGLSKLEIAKETGLSVASCNTFLNELASTGEVLGVKKKTGGVGPNSMLYSINPEFESFLCVRFDFYGSDIEVRSYRLTSNASVLEEEKEVFDYLDGDILLDYLLEKIDKYGNVSTLLLGTPSIAENGVIQHCDIEELDGFPILEKLRERKPNLLLYLENDMHFKAYGYYKMNKDKEKVVTLANFPSHVFPGTASVSEGHIIKGCNGFAGMIGFLPYGMKRDVLLRNYEKKTARPLISEGIIGVIALINPQVIVLTGDLLDEDCVNWLKEDCLLVIPEEYLPTFVYIEDMDEYYLKGMYYKALDLKEN